MRTPAHQLPSSARGFTLIELMISIAIVLVLMLGINFVFSTSAGTVSTGMALSTVGRDLRGARRVLEDDFKNTVAATEMPALIIHNESVFAWRDRQDKLADYDAGTAIGPATYDVDGDQANGDEVDLNAALYANLFNFRRHRTDRISFFVNKTNGEYLRQTGDATTYVGPETSPEAWISYGMLRQPGKHPGTSAADRAKDGLTYWKPGARGAAAPPFLDEGYNQNNFFASQWILGRNVVLLKDSGSLAAAAAAYRTSPWLTFSSDAAGVARENPPYPAAGAWGIQESRIDLAAATIEQIRAITVAAGGWADADVAEALAFDEAAAAPTFNYLFWAKPYVDKTGFGGSINHQTREAALITPIFLRGCTQFTVEFAGDFFDQSGAGTEPLGTIDFDTPAVGTTQIRWYGMNRDIDGDGVVMSGTTPDIGDVTTIANHVANTALPHPTRFTTGTVAAIEHLPTVPGGPTIWAWGPTTGAPPTGDGTTAGTQGNATFVRPALIRITLELIDANGRLPDGQRMEFIYTLKN